MSPEAAALKKFTLDRYEYLAEDNIANYDEILFQAKQEPDEFWETEAKRKANPSYFNYYKG